VNGIVGLVELGLRNRVILKEIRALESDLLVRNPLNMSMDLFVERSEKLSVALVSKVRLFTKTTLSF
jgi:hypothetical protein